MLKNIIQEIMKKEGYTNASLAEKCGYSYPSAVGNMLDREFGMRVDNLIKLLEAMNCSLIIRSGSDDNEWCLGESTSDDSQRRISQMESILDTAEENISNLEQQIAKYKELQTEIKKLENYYVSDEWKQDYALDEQGKLPENLKRGVLSEDAIHNLLERNEELLNTLKG